MSIFNKVNDYLNASSTFDKALSLLQGSQGSEWHGLNQHLIARFYKVKPVGEGKERRWVKEGNVIVHAPILEGAEFEYQLNWQSPFENSGTESKAPALTAMLQSGTLTQAYQHLMGAVTGETPNGAATETLKSLEGRTGITKLNSVQTFAGMPPVKCTMKLLFRAWQDPESEVMTPIKTLLKWAMPQELSQDGALVRIADAATTEQSKWIDVLMPSKAPSIIAMEYKGRIYSPMVIETIADPITSPIDAYGRYVKAEVNLSISSLSAWDKYDIAKIYGG